MNIADYPIPDTLDDALNTLIGSEVIIHMIGQKFGFQGPLSHVRSEIVVLGTTDLMFLVKKHIISVRKHE